MRAAVVGANWGAVHVAALREAGVEVVALVGRDPGRTRQRAAELGVALAVTDLAQLSRLDVELFTVATPASSHLAVIGSLPDHVPVICEKPAVGRSATGQLPAGRTAGVVVNYAFAFLDVADRAARALSRIGTVTSASVRCDFDLPGPARPIGEMFVDLMVHPWSWVVTLLGPPSPARPGVLLAGAANCDKHCGFPVECGQVPTTLTCTRSPGLGGIRHEARLTGDRGSLTVTGQYRVGQDWVFQPPQLHVDQIGTAPDRQTQTLGGVEAGPGDPWYRANARAIAAAVTALRGGLFTPELFDWERALALDIVAQAGLAAAAGRSA